MPPLRGKDDGSRALHLFALFVAAVLLVVTAVQAFQVTQMHAELEEKVSTVSAAAPVPVAAPTRTAASAPAPRPAPTMVGGC